MAQQTEVVVEGLVGTQTGNTGSLPITCTDDIFGTTALWNQGAGRLTLTVPTGKLITPNKPYVVSFLIQNDNSPTALASAPVVGISATVYYQYAFNWWSSISTPVPREDMDASTDDALGVVSGATPLFLIDPEFVTKTVGQSNPLTRSSNVITLTLEANCDIIAGSLITVDRLRGSATNDNPAIELFLSDPDAFEPTGDWDQSSGIIIVTVAGNGTRAFTPYEISFYVTNPSNAGGPDTTRVRGFVFESPFGPDSTVVTASVTMDQSTYDALGVSGGGRAMYRVTPELTTKIASQTFPFTGGSNNHTFTFQANCDLRAGTTITIDGLTGTQSPTISVFPSLFQLEYWSQATGDVVVSLTSDTVQANEYALLVQTVNQATARSPLLYHNIEAEIPSEGGHPLSEGGDSPSEIARTFMDIPSGTIFGVSEGDQSLRIVVPSFSTLRAAQSSPLTGASNELTVTLQYSYGMPVGSTVTISGLNGTASTSLSLESAVLPTTTSSWDPATGVLVVTLDAEASALTNYAYSLVVRNGPSAQDSPALTATGSAASGGPVDAPLAEAPVIASTSSRLGLAGGAAPLFLFFAGFDVKQAAQSNPLTQAETTVSVTLSTNIDVPVGSTLVLAGLDKSLTPDDATLGVDVTRNGFAASTLGTTGVWVQANGTLSLTVATGQTLAASDTYVLVFTLRNSASAQSSPGMTASVLIEGGEFDSELPPTLLDTPVGALLGVPGGGAPMYAEYASFSTTFIRQSTPFTIQVNALYVSLTPRQDMVAGTTITINGLTLTFTNSTEALPLLDDSDGEFFPNATWKNGIGELVVTLNGPLTNGQLYVFSFELENPKDQTDFPRNLTLFGSVPQGGAFATRIPLQYLEQSTARLLGLQDGSTPMFVITIQALSPVAWQTTPFPAVENTIFMRFKIIVDLIQGSLVTIAGLQGVISPTAMPCSFTPEDAFLEVCAFNSGSGVLTLAVAEGGLSLNNTVEMNITFTNPVGPQPEVMPVGAFSSSTDVQPPQLVVGGSTVSSGRTVNLARRVFEFPAGSMLGIPLVQGLTVTEPSVCTTLAQDCQLPFTIQSCAYESELADEAVSCMRKCNQTAIAGGGVGANIPDCCGLTCMDPCWPRQLIANLSEYFSASPASSSLPSINASLWRIPPYDKGFVPEMEHPGTVFVIAVLAPPCPTPAEPWLCEEGVGLQGTSRRLIDPISGVAAFDDLQMDGNLTPGDYELVLFASNFTREETGHRWGLLEPPNVWARGDWPVYRSGVFTKT